MSALDAQLGEILIVGNPVSGAGKGGRLLDEVAEHFRSHGSRVDVVKTTHRGHAGEEARAFRGTAILPFGGDGTVNEVLNGMDLERCALSVLPAGTGNVFAKELGLLTTPMRAARRIAQGCERRLDLGVCNGKLFLCMFGAGFDAHVVDLVHRARGATLSQLRYIPKILHAVVHWQRWDIRVEGDGEELIRGADVVCVGNTRSYGGPVSLTSDASPADGELDVMSTRVGGILGMVPMSLACLLHRTHRWPGIIYGRASSVRVSSLRRDVPYQLDGDLAGHLPADVHIVPGRVRVIAAAAFRPAGPAR